MNMRYRFWGTNVEVRIQRLAPCLRAGSTPYL
jgi:hypothetical protein